MSVLTIGDKRLGAALLDAGLLTDEELQHTMKIWSQVDDEGCGVTRAGEC